MTTHIDWEPKIIEEWLEDMVLTIRRLPNDVYLGYRGTWPTILYSEMEVLQMDKKPMRLQATQFDISRMELSVTWFAWIKDPEDRKLLWERAKRIPWKVICWERGVSRMTAWRKRDAALQVIAAHLNNPRNKDYRKHQDFLRRYLHLTSG